MNISIELTAILAGAFIGIFWLAGLSFAIKQSRKDLDSFQGIITDIRGELSDMRTSLGRIEGRLSNNSSRDDHGR